MFLKWFLSTLVVVAISSSQANDVTPAVFGNVKEGVVAAFGDFNSDELTDVFIIRDQMRTIHILTGEWVRDLELMVTQIKLSFFRAVCF